MTNSNGLPESPVVSAIGAGDIASTDYEPAFVAKFQRVDRLATLAAQGKINAVFIAGQAGVSKTTLVLGALAASGLEGRDYVICRGHSTPLGLYMALYEHGGDVKGAKLIVLDDCDGCLRSRDALNLVKAALDDKPTRTVTYLSSRLPGNVPTTFAFKGRLVFVSNMRLAASQSADLDAIRSRCHYAEIYLSRAEVLEFIAKVVVPADFGGTTLRERQFIFDLFRKAASNSAVQISARTYHQLVDLFVMDRDHFDLHVNELLPVNEDVRLLRALLDKCMTVEEAASAYQKITGKSRRTFFLLKRRYSEVLGC